MGRMTWKAQAGAWMWIARRIPTMFLQEALSQRAGVTTTVVGPADPAVGFTTKGPCIITINRD